jgi:predicted nucleic acid-binding protein
MSILVDSSVWVEFLRNRGTLSPVTVRLKTLLLEDGVMSHPAVIGELACGNLRNRNEFLGLLERLPMVHPASHQEVLGFIKSEKLFGQGLGWVDVQLLAAARLNGAPLWTLDMALRKASARLKVAAAK